jgi:predicted LPLAT superfamily acyltransferase
VIVRELKADEESNPRKKAALLAQKFAAQLETQIKNYPCQWFNFFEFF